MSVTLDTRKAHLVRTHGDLTAIYTWLNDERAVVIAAHLRPGSPWYVVPESACYEWDDNDPANVPLIVQKCQKACEVLGVESSMTNCMRIARIVIEGIPDLIRMPPKPPDERVGIRIGAMQLRAEGELLVEQDVRMPVTSGVTYG
ncbi:MAG: hypothetical protein ACRCV9_03060 [Burkholderiaceae bacterium]